MPSLALGELNRLVRLPTRVPASARWHRTWMIPLALVFGHSRAAAATPVTHYRTAGVDGVSIIYREAGSADAPVVLPLHGFPTSSHMFRNLIPALADRYHVIAPDYPGFGESAAPDHTTFAYTFAHCPDLMDGLMAQLEVKQYAMYLMDYGAPVGYRLALKHPERVTALVIQNGNAYEEGLKKFWDPIKAYWADGSDAHPRALDFLVKPETTKFQYTDGVSDVTRIDPDNWGTINRFSIAPATRERWRRGTRPLIPAPPSEGQSSCTDCLRVRANRHRILTLVHLLPKLPAPLKIVLVDVEVVGVREATQQGRGQRNKIKGVRDRRLRLDRSQWLGVVMLPLGEERFHLGMLGTVGALSLLTIRGP